MNLTQEQLAEKFGTSPQAISRWEIGATYPDIEMLPMIASFFETSVDALLGVTEEEKEKRCSELQKSFEIAVRAKDVQETVEIMREIRRNLKDYQQYWFWGMYNEIWKVRLFQDKSVLEEMRLLAEEVFRVCPKDQHYAVYHRFQKILERANCKRVRFHDLRHTFATMALENGMDIKTLSAMIGHVSAETTLNIYSHITDTMQQQAAARIDREIAGADTPIPEPNATDGISGNETDDQPTEPKFEPYKGKIRKPGTGCVTMINDHLYEGRFSPRVNGKRIAKNIYATTREECEEKLKVLIAEMKKEIAEIKAGEKAINKG